MCVTTHCTDVSIGRSIVLFTRSSKDACDVTYGHVITHVISRVLLPPTSSHRQLKTHEAVRNTYLFTEMHRVKRSETGLKQV